MPSEQSMPGRCGAKVGDGFCTQWPIKGTKRCRMHPGKPIEQAKAEGQIRLEVQKWMLDGHDTSGVDPRAVFIDLIAMWRWRTNKYGQLLGEAYEAAERLRQAHAAGELLVSGEGAETAEAEGWTEDPNVQRARVDLDRIFTTGGVAALVGNRYDADREGRVYAVDEGIRALEKLSGEASDRLARYCAQAVTAKVAESQIELNRMAGGMIAAVIRGVLADFGVVASDERVNASIADHMDAVSGLPRASRVIEGRAA